MSDVTNEITIIRDQNRLIHSAKIDEWTTLTLVGALSVDPRTLDELDRAWQRFEPEQTIVDLPWSENDVAPGNRPWILLDLANQRLVAGNGCELPEDRASYQKEDGPWHAEMPVAWTNMPPHWEQIEAANWEDAMPPIPDAVEPLDFRGVLFGRALANGIAQRCLELADHETLPVEYKSWETLGYSRSVTETERVTAKRWYALTVKVHADWLMTPHDDLEGETPRLFLHHGRDWIEHELWNREQQWSRQHRAPRALDRDTFAYRHGPMGRDEVVMHFDLCREMIGKAWKCISEQRSVDVTAVANEVHECGQRWLKEGSIDGEPTPPAAIIESERRRVPLVGDASHLDCDCPLCRMQSDSSMGPMFQGIDGHHLELDDEFAFSLCATREEWQLEQAAYGDLEPSDENSGTDDVSELDDDTFDSVWKSSYVNESTVGQDPQLALFALATRVTELVSDLKSSGAPQQLVDQLNCAFDDYRDSAADSVLSQSAARQFVEVLEALASDQPNLIPKVADLQSKIDEYDIAG